ncbi:TIGR04255 family protein [Mycobacterium sp. 236(2023)]|uniref:TIGR04255 family protein n=1 Tax=Mycobacterium sp. 236(2023) TaxID=3038163 RepID=UPI002414F531|nr:TIGR04255 family protein [Mycobacterium sp. 236(2023)]MDG4666060.1 TIGR04255 family protein [Mycobacterium sp. 236(2023)]
MGLLAGLASIDSGRPVRDHRQNTPRQLGISFSYSFGYTGVVTAHPTYPTDALALVLVELRHPVTDPPVRAALTFLRDQLSEWTPIIEQEEMRQIDMNTGAQTVFTNKKLVARDRHTAITFRHDAMTVEVTDYPGWAKFWPIVRATVAARQDVSPVDGCLRIGLRYINEIRAPLDNSSTWSKWVSNSLLGPGSELSDLKLAITAQQHVVQCDGPGPGASLTLRYGAARGSVIQSTPILQRLKEPPENGHFFLLDIDSAWSDPKNGIPAFEINLIEEVAERLHEPINPLFESLITDDLRTTVLEKES